MRKSKDNILIFQHVYDLLCVHVIATIDFLINNWDNLHNPLKWIAHFRGAGSPTPFYFQEGDLCNEKIATLFFVKNMKIPHILLVWLVRLIST